MMADPNKPFHEENDCKRNYGAKLLLYITGLQQCPVFPHQSKPVTGEEPNDRSLSATSRQATGPP
jgi:hypothetical protein